VGSVISGLIRSYSLKLAVLGRHSLVAADNLFASKVKRTITVGSDVVSRHPIPGSSTSFMMGIC